ncbi:MAG: hypothetical protein KF746_03270 [Chitinophagaceae bacterium]|nr:hypothetical protein [Chitinophagaceae bacterium]
MKQNSFPYAYWVKILGVLIILACIVIFSMKYYYKGIFDFNELAVGLSWGFVFFFFSKEKTDDEMMRGLKFRSLSNAIIIAFSITQLYNYFFLNLSFNREHDDILSISAYQFLALTLIIATVNFYYLKHRLSINEVE